jgi:hypothetical protein
MPISQAVRFNVDFHRSEHKRASYEAEVPSDLSFDEILKPSFWAHVGDMLRPRDVIEVWPKDNTWMAELRVVDCGHLYAKVALVSRTTMETREDDAPLEIEALASGKFRVRRGPDVMKEGLASKKDAQRWIDDYAPKAKPAQAA